MNKDFDDVGREGRNVKKLRGWVKEFQFIHDLNILDSDNKTIYSTLLEKTVKKNGSLIPSRNEKRTRGVKWKVTWRNLTLLRNVNPYEKCFGWKMTQDLVEVGARLHRNGANKQCAKMKDGALCNTIETLEHRLFLCENVHPLSTAVKSVIERLIGKSVDRQEILCLNLTHRKRSTLCLCLWFTIKAMVLIYNGKLLSKTKLFNEISSEIRWNLVRR